VNSQMTVAERAWVGKVKELPCSVCGVPGPSDAHHIKQGRHFAVVALCKSCHQGHNGWHGTKAMWRIHKMDELDALDATLRAMNTNRISTGNP